MSQEDILQSMNSRLTLGENKTEGTFGQDVLGSVAYEIDRTEELKINTLLDRAFALTAKGEDLDRVGNDNDVLRKQAQSAKVTVTIKGNKDIVVTTGMQISYADLIFTSLETKQIPEGGTVDVEFQCDTPGSVGNVPAGVQFDFVSQVYGLTSAIAKDAGHDGFDTEDDESYRERILAKIRSEASSGNAAHYKQWAEEIPGVSKALIKPLAYGNGTVGVRIATPDNQTPSEELLTQVRNHINEEKPIGATVTVESVEYVDINIVANVNIDSSSSQEAVKSQFNVKLAEYLKSLDTDLDEPAVVSYLKMSDLLFDCKGVKDVLSYTMNGGSVSIPLTEIQIARGGETTINAQG